MPAAAEDEADDDEPEAEPLLEVVLPVVDVPVPQEPFLMHCKRLFRLLWSHVLPLQPDKACRHSNEAFVQSEFLQAEVPLEHDEPLLHDVPFTHE